MSILEARFNGTPVFAEMGEALRGKEVMCKHCGAKMEIKRFPEKEDEYYFALKKNERHEGACQYYDGNKNAPVFTGTFSPEEFIAGLSPKNGTGDGGGNKGGGKTGGGASKEPQRGPTEIKSLRAIIKTGMYDEKPFEPTYLNSDYRFIDIIIFDKWGRLIWNVPGLPQIGARVIDARWLGSFNYTDKAHERVIDVMKKTKEIWFVMFWKVNGKYTSVRFCLDCSSCFADIKKKLFTSGARENNTYSEFMPKKGKVVDVLVGARWATMSKEHCKEKCPLNRMCDGCLGAYWSRCDGPKHVELFPADKIYKNKDLNNGT